MTVHSPQGVRQPRSHERALHLHSSRPQSPPDAGRDGGLDIEPRTLNFQLLTLDSVLWTLNFELLYIREVPLDRGDEVLRLERLLEVLLDLVLLPSLALPAAALVHRGHDEHHGLVLRGLLA